MIMKRKEIKALHEKTKEELEKMLGEKRLSLVKLRTDLASGKTKNVKALARERDEIAQILTIIKEKEILEGEPAIAKATAGKKNERI